MAITILDEPQIYWPICNDVEWIFESTNFAQVNFSFVIELYVEGNIHSTHEVYPEFSASGKFNISTIGRAILTSVYCNPAIQVQELNTDQTFSILIYEKYGAVPVIYLASMVASSGINFLNGAFRYDELYLNQYAYTTYNVNSGANRLFLTDFPRDKRDLVAYNESKFLAIINQRGAGLTGEVILYDITGTQITSDTWSITEIVPLVSVGPSALVNFTSLVIGDFTNCYYYTIRLYETLNPTTRTSEAYKIYYDTSCSSYERIRLHWLNRFGAWDSFSFTLLSEESTEIQANRYSRATGRWTTKEDYYVYSRSITDGHQMTMSKFMQDKLILNSDWIHQDVQQWLVRSLYESPRVYLETELGQTSLRFEPVVVTNSSSILKQRRKFGLIQELVTIDRTYTKVSQLG